MESNKEKKGVSIWRTLLVCNEFSELTKERYINRTSIFLMAAFLLKGLQWENWAVE